MKGLGGRQNEKGVQQKHINDSFNMRLCACGGDNSIC